ncbi:MAG: mechanosensitive ion channel [Rhodobacteraceae bacterium]|uniref:mechanosensitive ion channel family protein n=1 Tax=Albidovulum sp. TaxID=1872424 RepID=UPI001DEAAC32|nr:mechanosensitive ion channel [Paracoccaceae bacterium]MCC0045460.1 mechanosensitive ion channel [Defluviimonas sp.]HRV63762.1 mechanosensitive ion channel [Albidovulum sp.]MCB2121449.1 mechanosensitive ion channel [Paracoccaceae bacterium]MCB2138412.1 mechanosensitive ion channel [Paracoccaceae bacterium]
METEIQEFIAALGSIYDSALTSLHNLLLPSRLNQMVILIVCALAAWALRQWAAPRLNEWLRGREGWPKWRLRLAVLLQNRLQLIFFVLLAWGAVAVIMSISTFPSRRYLVALGATVATGWLAVSLATRLVRNKPLRRIVTWGLWIYVTLYYLDLLTPVADFLGGLAIQFGQFDLSALAVLKGVVLTALLLTGARLIAQVGSGRIQADKDISPSMQVLAIKLLQVILYGAAVFIGIKSVGFDLSGLAFLSGAIGVGLGFGLQKVVSNLVSGVIILLDKSIKPGDVISLGETFGWIEALGARYVSVVTRDGKEYLIPNEDLITNQVVNWSHSDEYVRLDINFGTSYGDDPHLVRRIAIDAAQSVDRVLKFRAPVCHIVGFGDSSVDYILRFWIQDPSDGLTNVRGAVFLALWDAFAAEGISIPFPQREVRILNGEDAPATVQLRHPPTGTV